MDIVTLAMDDVERAVTLMNRADPANQNQVEIFRDHARDKLDLLRQGIAQSTIDDEWRGELIQRLRQIMSDCTDTTLSIWIGELINGLQ